MDFVELKPLFTKIFNQIEESNANVQKLREENQKLREELEKYQVLFSEISSQPRITTHIDTHTKNLIVDVPISNKPEGKKRGRKAMILTEEEKKARKAEYNRRYREGQKN
jgi:hypothetical protein